MRSKPLANLDLALKMFDMQSTGVARRSSSNPSSAPAACWSRRKPSCRRCARRPTIAAVATTVKIEETIHFRKFAFYTSHVSDPLAAEVGLAVLDVIQKEKLVARANVMGAYLRGRFEELQQRYELIGDVCGLGLLLGVELVTDRTSRTPTHKLGALTTQKCFENGFSMNIRRRPERGSVWHIAPPLTVSHAEIDGAIDILEKSIGESRDELAASKAT